MSGSTVGGGRGGGGVGGGGGIRQEKRKTGSHKKWLFLLEQNSPATRSATIITFLPGRDQEGNPSLFLIPHEELSRARENLSKNRIRGE